MSIIHDALKKVQQSQMPKPEEKPVPAGNIFQDPVVPLDDQPPAVKAKAKAAQAVQTKAKSLLALICALVITLGAAAFLFKQLNTYSPQVKRWAVSSFYKLIHQKEPVFKPAPKELVPLAQITVKAPAPNTAPAASTKAAVNPAPSAVALPAVQPAPVVAPQTLNIHGVMSNGASNIVLINNQVYQEGDEVEGVKIVKINLDNITVINNGKEEKIRVKN